MSHSNKGNISKTNAARILDRAGVEYRLVPYMVDESDLSAPHVAAELGEDIRQVFKTLVLRGDRCGYFVCVVPGDAEVDLKKAARVAGDKKVDLIAMRDLLGVTGYIRGGCSPLGMKKVFPTFFHETATEYDVIYVSAGVRGLQIEASGEDLIRVCNARTADIIKEDE